MPVLLQSGSNFTLNKFDVESDENKLRLSGQGQVFYMNICTKYSDMFAMASRTMIVNPLAAQKAAYQLAFEAEEFLFKELTVGKTLKEVYASTKEFIRSKDPKLAEKIHKNFGFGIGCEIKENLLEISATNEAKIEAGMVFHARITFCDGDIIVAIGDTVHVNSEGTLDQLTENVPREYARISFTLEEDEEEDDEEEEKSGKERNSTLPDSSAANQLGNGNKRTRAGRVTAASEKMQKDD
jgi:nucleosome binding factor SPN SPT16 subunit